VVADSKKVALVGYRGLMAGRRVVIEGLANKFMTSSIRFMPRGLVTKIVKKVQEKEEQN
jgi:short-subunit dehydrogenase